MVVHRFLFSFHLPKYFIFLCLLPVLVHFARTVNVMLILPYSGLMDRQMPLSMIVDRHGKHSDCQLLYTVSVQKLYTY